MDYYQKYKIRQVCKEYANKNSLSATEVYRLVADKMGICLNTFYKRSRSHISAEIGCKYYCESKGFKNYELKRAAEFLGTKAAYLMSKRYRQWVVNRHIEIKKWVKELEAKNEN